MVKGHKDKSERDESAGIYLRRIEERDHTALAEDCDINELIGAALKATKKRR